MILGFTIDVLLAAVYALFLVGIAIVLEFVARHSHDRSEHFRNSGFIYRKGLDVWECPAGQHLKRERTDLARKIAHYRAPARHCNACPNKADCTDSDEGRLLESRLGAWLHSEMSRFHRGISLALIFLALVILTLEMLWHHARQDWVILGALWVPIGFLGYRHLISFLKPRAQSEPTPAVSSSVQFRRHP